MSIPTGNTGNIPEGMQGYVPQDSSTGTQAGTTKGSSLPATEQPIADTTESGMQPLVDPSTGKVILDPKTGQPIMVTPEQQANFNKDPKGTALPNQEQAPDSPAYQASSQFPALSKPAQEGPALAKPSTEAKAETKTETKTEKQDKKTEKEATGSAEGSQQGDGTVQVDGEPEAPQEQDQGGQSDSGTGGGNTGSESGSSNSGSSSGGDPSNKERGSGTVEGFKQTEGASAIAGVNATASASIAVGVSASSSVKTPITAENAEAAYRSSLDPTGKAVVTASGLFSPPISPAQFFSNADKMLNEISDMAAKLLASLPEGPDKTRFVDYLKMIQDALSQFGQLLRELQMHDSKGAVDRSKAALETSLAKIEKQREEQAEMAKKSEEAAKKANIMKALAPLFVFLLVLLLPLLLPLMMLPMLAPAIAMLMALIIGEICDQCATAAGKKPFAIQAIADAIMTAVEFIVDICATAMNFPEEARKTAKLVFKMIATALVMVVTTLACPLAVLGGGISALMSFLSATKVIKNTAMASGMEEEEAAKVDMYVGIAIGALAAIATLGLALVIPGAQGGILSSVGNAARSICKAAFDMITKILSVITNMIDKVAGKAASTVKAVLKAVFDPDMLLQMTMMGVQTTSAVVTYQQQSLLAEIALIHGRMDSDIELKDATIQMLKKMIKQLLDGLNGIGDDMASIAQSLKKTHTGVSEITSSLFA